MQQSSVALCKTCSSSFRTLAGCVHSTQYANVKYYKQAACAVKPKLWSFSASFFEGSSIEHLQPPGPSQRVGATFCLSKRSVGNGSEPQSTVLCMYVCAGTIRTNTYVGGFYCCSITITATVRFLSRIQAIGFVIFSHGFCSQPLFAFNHYFLLLLLWSWVMWWTNLLSIRPSAFLASRISEEILEEKKLSYWQIIQHIKKCC